MVKTWPTRWTLVEGPHITCSIQAQTCLFMPSSTVSGQSQPNGKYTNHGFAKTFLFFTYRRKTSTSQTFQSIQNFMFCMPSAQTSNLESLKSVSASGMYLWFLRIHLHRYLIVAIILLKFNVKTLQPPGTECSTEQAHFRTSLR